MGRQRFPRDSGETGINVLSASAPDSGRLIPHWVSFLVAFVWVLSYFCSEMSHLALKTKILSFAFFFSIRFSNSSARCMMSLWHEAYWLWSCISQFSPSPPHCLCPQNTVVTATNCGCRTLTAFLCCWRGTKGCRVVGGFPRSTLLSCLPLSFVKHA